MVERAENGLQIYYKINYYKIIIKMVYRGVRVVV